MFFPGTMQGCSTSEFGSRWAFRTATNVGFSIYYVVFFAQCKWGNCCWLNVVLISTAFYWWVEGWNIVWLVDAELHVLAMLGLCHRSPVHKPSKQVLTRPSIQSQSSTNNSFVWNLRFIIRNGQREQRNVRHQHYGYFLLKTIANESFCTDRWWIELFS